MERQKKEVEFFFSLLLMESLSSSSVRNSEEEVDEKPPPWKKNLVANAYGWALPKPTQSGIALILKTPPAVSLNIKV